MKRKNITLASVFIAAMLCLSLAACSSGEEDNDSATESDMPQISVDMSESVQTTPENSPQTAETAETADGSEESTVEPPQTLGSEGEETTERSETAIIENAADTEANTEANIDNAAVTESSSESETDISAPDAEIGANGIVEAAAEMVGKPFYFGGADPETGFDNSGLMHYVLRANGVDCPRLTGDIAEWGEKVTYDELRPGYLVFFEYEGSGKADFGGIYIGGGKMVVSTDEDRPVSEVDITTAYYQRTFQYGIKTF